MIFKYHLVIAEQILHFPVPSLNLHDCCKLPESVVPIFLSQNSPGAPLKGHSKSKRNWTLYFFLTLCPPLCPRFVSIPSSCKGNTQMVSLYCFILQTHTQREKRSSLHSAVWNQTASQQRLYIEVTLGIGGRYNTVTILLLLIIRDHRRCVRLRCFSDEANTWPPRHERENTVELDYVIHPHMHGAKIHNSGFKQ